nr:ORF58 [Human gammaherpesvirus 8]UQT63949.1 ORF58 [Human gammaherpesvirus 8]
MCRLDSERALSLFSYLSGTLAATPFLWCFIFKAQYSFTLFTTEITAVFFWSLPVTHLALICMCLCPAAQKQLDRRLEWICASAVFAAVVCAAFSGFTFSRVPFIPGLCVLNCLLLLPYPLATATAVYQAPPIVHRYYELGFCGAFMVYYLLLFKKVFVSGVFWLPFIVFLVGGLLAFRHLEQHVYIRAGMQRRRAIFIMPGKYITYSVFQAWAYCRREVVVFVTLLLATLISTASIGLLTPVLIGLDKYMTLFYVGLLSCVGVSVASRRALFVLLPLAAVLLTLVHILGSGPDMLLVRSCLCCLFLVSMLAAMGVEIQLIRRKLHRALNAPQMVLALCTVGNLCISCLLSVINKVVG